jgi:hypothetical protein
MIVGYKQRENEKKKKKEKVGLDGPATADRSDERMSSLIIS